MDMELACSNALLKLKSDIEISYRYFHLGQCVWRKVQDLGLRARYGQDDTFRLNVKMLVSLACVPVHDVTLAFVQITTSYKDEEFQQVADYFEDNYIGCMRARGGRRMVPKFTIASWNCFERIRTGDARTNNAVEGWNRAFNATVNTKHPNIALLVAKLQDEQKNAEMMMEQIVGGDNPKYSKKKRYQKIDDRLKELAGRYNGTDILTYLRGVSHNIAL